MALDMPSQAGEARNTELATRSEKASGRERKKIFFDLGVEALPKPPVSALISSRR
jgi:hypothetical protein